VTPYDPSLSDGCSFAPDLSTAVYACCVLHDEAWHVLGSWLTFFTSNIALGTCIGATDWAVFALPYALATTLCGWPIWLWRSQKKQREQERCA
jgi:hypothetical protein